MTTVVVHIGVHQTGARAIQRFLDANRPRLAELGVIHPAAGFTDQRSDRGPQRLVEEVQTGAASGAWQAVVDEIESSGVDVAVLSAEEFSRMTSGVRRVLDRLDGYDVRVVMYVRNPVAFLESAWKRQVVAGAYTGRFGSFVRDRYDRADFGAMADRWAAVVGDDRFDVRVYEHAVATTGLTLDFIAAIGLDTDLAWRLPRVPIDTSQDRGTLALIRRLGWAEHRFPSQASRFGALRRAANRQVGRWAAVLRVLGGLFDRPTIGDEDLVWLAATLGDSHRRFLDRHVPAPLHQHLQIGPGARAASPSS